MTLKWAVLLGSPDISGGTYVIFEHTIRACRRGIDVTIITEEPVRDEQLKWHPEARVLRFRTFAEVTEETFDVALATWWKTVYELHRVDAHRYGYFVQSIESWFYPPEERPLRQLVDSTYQLDLPIITEATWIQKHLQEHALTTPQLVHNGIRKDIYTMEGDTHAPRVAGKLRILLEGPLGVAFKNVERTLELAKRSKADEIWLLTSSPVQTLPGVDRIFSRVPIFETPKIYRSCDVIVKLSYVEGMFGPPLEMFHCGGTAITYDVTGHDEYLVSGENCLVAKRDDEDQVVAYINQMKDDSELLARLKTAAQTTAVAWPDWDVSSRQFEAAMSQMTQIDTPDRARLKLRTRFFLDCYTIGETYKNQFAALSTLQPCSLKRHVKMVIAKRYHLVRGKLSKLYRQVLPGS